MADFFGKIAGGLSKGVANVSANSKAMMEKARVNSVISNLEGEIGNLQKLLGAKVYSMHTSGSEVTVTDEMANFFTEITKRHEMIAERQEELKRIEEELSLVTGGSAKSTGAAGATCSCGSTNVEGAKFCASCGSSLA